MDTIARFEPRRMEPLDRHTASQPDAGQQLTVTAMYVLSEEGRKVSLLTGGNGRAVQEITFTLPVNRLHLVTVDARGRAWLKLRPRFELNAEQRVVRIDAPPMYEVPPTLDELFREAGRNHQLEHAFRAEHSAARQAEREADRQRRADVADAFLKDPARRPLRRPTPTPERCHVGTSDGRMLFDVKRDDGPARLVPPEAYRRFRSDLHARKARKQQETAAQIASHEHKMRVIAEWIQQHGTPEQQARHAEGVLPIDEALDAIADQAFAAGDGFARYAFDGAARLQERLRQLPRYVGVAVHPTDLTIVGADAVKATGEQWALVRQLRDVFPDATVTLREHQISWKGAQDAPTVTVFGVIVTRRVGPFDLRREYAAPNADVSVQP